MIEIRVLEVGDQVTAEEAIAQPLSAISLDA